MPRRHQKELRRSLREASGLLAAPVNAAADVGVRVGEGGGRGVQVACVGTCQGLQLGCVGLAFGRNSLSFSMRACLPVGALLCFFFRVVPFLHMIPEGRNPQALLVIIRLRKEKPRTRTSSGNANREH